MGWRKFIVLIFTFQIYVFTCFGQNLVRNGSFESWHSNKPEGVKDIATSPDYFKSNLKVYPHYYYEKSFSSRFPEEGSDGVSYIGLGSSLSGSECIMLELSEQLEKDSAYVISFDIYKPPIYTNNTTSYFVYHLSNEVQSQYTEYGYKNSNSYALKADSLVHDNWLSVRDTIQAKGDETYLYVFNPISDNKEMNYYFLYDNFKVNRLHERVLNVFFESNSEHLSDPYKQYIDIFLNNVDPNKYGLLIEGFSDGVGKNEDNYLLSARRTRNVSKYIESYSSQIVFRVNNYGEHQSENDISDKSKRNVRIKIIEIPKRKDIVRVPLDVLDAIEEMYKEDQRLRSKENLSSHTIQDAIQSLVKEQAKSIDNIFDKYDYVGATQIGVEKMDYLAVLLLHQDIFILKKNKQKILRAVRQSECSPFIFPYLMDKIQVAENNSQVFGTQYFIQNDSIIFYPIIELEEVDRRRAKFGLSSIKEYEKSLSLK